jgi:hypothetical protein
LSVRWRKLGRVFCAAGEHDWMQGHAFSPTAIALDGGERVRVLCAVRDGRDVGRVAWVDVAGDDPTRVLGVSARPALDIGVAGAFDDNGVTPLCVVEHEGTHRLYYLGWQLQVRVRYTLFTGLAISRDGATTFERVSQAPVLDRCDGELTVRSSCTVLREGDRWRMWYAGGGDRWVHADGVERPEYVLRHLESDDGVRWPDGGRVCLAPANEDEHGFSRPCVLRDGDGWRMWYSRRTRSQMYRLGYATSSDGLDWQRHDDEAGLDVSASGWDSEMVGLSDLAATPHGTYLFYNGNGYGATGFGVAVAEGL